MSKRKHPDTTEKPTARGVQKKAKKTLPSNFYKECNKIYAKIKSSKFDTQEIIKRLMRMIKKHELSRPQAEILSSRSRKSKDSTVPSLAVTDSIKGTATMSASTSEGAKTNSEKVVSLLSACVSNLTVLADLNKQLLKPCHGSPEQVTCAIQEDELFSFFDSL